MDYFKGEILKSLAFLKSIRICVLVATLIFVGFAVGEYIYASYQYVDDPQGVVEQIDQLFASIVEGGDILLEDGNISAVGLFKNNFIAAFSATSLGIFPFLFLPVLPIALNGWVIGLVSALSLSMGQGVLYFVASIMPHGIFEIPALLIATGLGLYTCLNFSALIIGRKRKYNYDQLMFETARGFVLIVFPLLAIAAVIEAYITPLVMAMVLK